MTRRLVIIEGNKAAAARGILRAHLGEGDNALSAPLSPTGEEPATHYALNGLFDEVEFDARRTQDWTVHTYDDDADPGFAVRKIAELGLMPVTPQDDRDLTPQPSDRGATWASRDRVATP